MISGIINLKKEAGMTSHDAVFKLRKILNEKKIGHGGTLDPDVTGVLPIAVGKSTRIIEYMTEAGKVYEGEITIGFSTTTEDASGEVVNVTVVSDLTEEAVDAAMSRFVGQITQVPPMYSAVKVNGRRLYEYARQGEVVERPSRRVTITEFSRTSPIVLNNNCAMFSFRVVCSKGTYVRTLSVDLGTALGYASHMSALQRTASAGLELSSALTLEQIKEKVNAGDWGFLLPIEYGVSELPRVELIEEAVTEISYGRRVALDAITPLVAGFHDGKVIAILEARDNLYKPRKVLI
ncbi:MULTISPECIES: tRNA pseudouridine(55) synthase TruB [Streptococcus]|uniref:tRNA pseudouridine synthase B n=1 Tax=Streptococcus caledonicus TaxID=2614158 RepID=A0ABW0UCU7_9STRE|nr:tRNA pseudouridine(55) synthase TruB [Streptococcus sp. S784/96/1]